MLDQNDHKTGMPEERTTNETAFEKIMKEITDEKQEIEDEQ